MALEDLYPFILFENVAAYVYTIEDQNCELSYMHLLLIMSPQDRIHNPVEIDDLIPAEIPTIHY